MTARYPAFTLIELLVVVTIMIVLMSIGIASFSSAGKSARDAKRKSDMETVRQAMVVYKTQSATGDYPTGNYTTATATLVNASGAVHYLSPPAPTDPKNTGSYVYSGTVATTSTFCFCATLELPTSGNSNSNTCAGTWASTGYQYYCVQQPY